MISSQIRMDEELWEKLKEIAKEEERSVNSEMVYIIKKYIEEKEKED